MTDTDLSIRRLTLTMLAVFLIVTAGCTTGIGGNPLSSDAAEANSETPETITPQNGTDLRSLFFDENFGSMEKEGELDGNDPRQEGRVYEPIVFAGQEGRYYNFTMDAETNHEELRLLNPNGEVVAVTTGDTYNGAKMSVQLNQTGQYTLHATSVEPSETFEYELSINEVAFAGPRDEWGEYERYSEFGLDVEHYWGEQHTVSDAEFESVNTSEDYVIIKYERGVDDNETVQSTHTAVMARTIIDTRNWIANDAEGLNRENPDEWYPERIYFKGYSEDDELVETNYVSQRWTAEYMAGGNEDTVEYYYRIVKTTKVGPAHNQYYTLDDNETVEEDQFPYPTYPEEYVDTLDKE